MAYVKVLLGVLAVLLLSFSCIAYTNNQTQDDLSGVYNPVTQEYIYMPVIPKQTQDCENKSIFVCEEVLS